MQTCVCQWMIRTHWNTAITRMHWFQCCQSVAPLLYGGNKLLGLNHCFVICLLMNDSNDCSWVAATVMSWWADHHKTRLRWNPISSMQSQASAAMREHTRVTIPALYFFFSFLKSKSLKRNSSFHLIKIMCDKVVGGQADQCSSYRALSLQSQKADRLSISVKRVLNMYYLWKGLREFSEGSIWCSPWRMLEWKGKRWSSPWHAMMPAQEWPTKSEFWQKAVMQLIPVVRVMREFRCQRKTLLFLFLLLTSAWCASIRQFGSKVIPVSI